jgi:hypothetical protein
MLDQVMELLVAQLEKEARLECWAGSTGFGSVKSSASLSVATARGRLPPACRSSRPGARPRPRAVAHDDDEQECGCRRRLRPRQPFTTNVRPPGC